MADHIDALRDIKYMIASTGRMTGKATRLAALDAAIAAIAQQSGAVAQGRVNGYLLSARAIEVIVDGDIPEWMTARPGLRVTIASSGPGGGGEGGNG